MVPGIAPARQQQRTAWSLSVGCLHHCCAAWGISAAWTSHMQVRAPLQRDKGSLEVVNVQLSD